jgi:hypothetical protein
VNTDGQTTENQRRALKAVAAQRGCVVQRIKATLLHPR